MCSYADDPEYVLSGRHIYSGGGDALTVTRRDVLKSGVAAAGAAALFAAPASAQAPVGAQGTGAPQGPGVAASVAGAVSVFSK
jgi:hypothetical protein